MNDELNSRVRADFSKARFKSFINQVMSCLLYTSDAADE